MNRCLILCTCTAFGSITLNAMAQKPVKYPEVEKQTQAQGYWLDPASGLMWAAKDNGSDVSWKKASAFCRSYRAGGFQDWRLASLAEEQNLYDPRIIATGLNPKSKWHDDEPMDFHVKGGLFLTGTQWTSTRRMDDRGKPSCYAWRFDFNEGRPFDGDELWFTTDKRALCVRASTTKASD